MDKTNWGMFVQWKNTKQYKTIEQKQHGYISQSLKKPDTYEYILYYPLCVKS